MFSPKMPRWGDEKTKKFIILYRKHQCLWNVRSPLYKNKVARNDAYQKIMDEMNDSNLSIKNMKTKIKGLRSTFHQEMKKIDSSKSSEAGTTNVYTPTLAWLNEMTFLKDVLEYRGTIWTQVPQQACTESLEQARSSSQESFELHQQPRPFSQVSTEALEHPQPTPDMPACIQPPNFNYRPKVSKVSKGKDKKRKRSGDETLIALKRLENIATTRCYKDEFYYFGLSVAAQLRALPLNNALDMQSKIQMLLSTERCQLSGHTSEQLYPLE